jgi:hypothetical protein
LYDLKSGDVFAPDDAGTVTWRLIGHYSLEGTATANTTDDVWEFRVLAATTAGITPASKADQQYVLQIEGVLSTIEYELGPSPDSPFSLPLFVFANPDVTAGDDRRTWGQKALALLQAEYLARLGGTAGTGHNRYALLGREIEKWTLAEIRAEIGHLESQVVRETHGRPKPIRIYFGQARN